MEIWHDIKLCKKDFFIRIHASEDIFYAQLSDLKNVYEFSMSKEDFAKALTENDWRIEVVNMPSIIKKHILPALLEPEDSKIAGSCIFLQVLFPLPYLVNQDSHYVLYCKFELMELGKDAEDILDDLVKISHGWNWT